MQLLAGAGGGRARRIRVPHLSRASWADFAWVIFIGLNLLAMRLIPAWQTVPFLIIWVSLTVMYGFRLWRLGSTVLTVTLVTVATGGLIGWQVLRGQQDTEYLVEVRCWPSCSWRWSGMPAGGRRPWWR